MQGDEVNGKIFDCRFQIADLGQMSAVTENGLYLLLNVRELSFRGASDEEFALLKSHFKLQIPRFARDDNHERSKQVPVRQI